MMLYMGSDCASFMNGEVMVLDGGMQVSSNGYNEFAIFARKQEEKNHYQN